MPEDTPQTLPLGYLVPQFPGQTHIFFWRELAELERLGVTPHILSTRPPPKGLISHEWSQSAMARTTYLGKADVAAAVIGALRAPWAEILREGEGRAFLRDVVICLPAARTLIAICRAAWYRSRACP